MSLRTRAFWVCCAILLLLGAGYAIIVPLFLSQADLLDIPGGWLPIWRAAVACWLVALLPICLIARLESRWVVRRIQEPIVAMVGQCREICDGRAAAHLSYVGNDRELGDLAAAVNGLLEHFNQIVERQHQFAADAAHELRTPLTAQSVVGENALAQRRTNAELREAIGSMLEEAKHMQRLIQNLLELTRASVARTAGTQSPQEPQPLELDKLARGCVESLQILAEEKEQSIQVTAQAVWVDADATLVRQALLNVIHNSIQHCPPGSRIEVATARFARHQAMIRVKDNGPGIALDQQAHVFKRFYRGPSAAGRRGLGLGLSIAKAFLKSQRGNIHLTSEPGAGCTFTLTLPLLPERPGASPTPLQQLMSCGDAGSR